MGCFSSKAVAGDAQPQVEFFDKYEMGDVLGRGAYGTVRLAYSVESLDGFAVKILDLNRTKQNPVWPRMHQLREDVFAEQRAWARIRSHPNVVGLRETFVDQTFAYFVMELCTSSLLTAWRHESELHEFTYARYFQGMAQALAHIHSVGVVHRDVKQDNFMVGGPDRQTVKLCDFGLSAVVGDIKSSGPIGTAPHMAPEMVTYPATHGPSADVWSLGVIVYNSFFGSWPYQPRQHTAEQMRKVIREGIVPPSFAPPRRFRQNVVSETGIRFVKELLDRNPLTRPTAASCLEMAYLDKMRCNQLQANGKTKEQISLVPQLWDAVNCGAFNVRSLTGDGCQEFHVTVRSTTQLRRESCLSSRDHTSGSTTATSNDFGTNPMPSQPSSSDIQDSELPIPTEELGCRIAL